MAKVTQFKNGKSPGNFIIRDSEDVLNDIKTGVYTAQIDTLNSFEYDSPEQKDFKTTQIPAIGWNGVFTYRANDKLVEHSGLVAIDFDHIPEDEFQLYFDKLKSDKYTYSVFRSPRRDGLKCIVRIKPDIQLHRALVCGLRQHYNSKYYDHFEDESRLCFISVDPDIYINLNAEEWNTPERVKQSNNKKSNEGVSSDISGVINRLIKWEENKGMYYVDRNKHKFLVSIFGATCRFGVKEDDSVDYLYNKLNESNETEFVNKSDYIKIARSSYINFADQFNTEKFTEAPKDNIPIQIEVEDEDPQKPSFPIDVFPEDIRNLIYQLNSALNYSKDYLSIAIMSTFATLNGNKFKLKVKNEWIAPTIFWFAAVGEPGVNKTHPLKSILKPIAKIDSKSKDEYDSIMKSLSAEDKKDETKKPKFKQIIINDYTLEALHSIHDINKRGVLLYRDELIGFLKDMNKYRKGSDEQFWLESFNNNSYIVNRVTKDPLMIEFANINIIGTIQPELLSQVIKEHAGNGLTDRFLYTTNETEIFPLNTSDVNERWVDWWKDIMTGYNQWSEFLDKYDTKIVNLTPIGMEELISSDSNLCELQKRSDTTYYMRNYISKMRTYLPRFSLLVCLIEVYLTGCTFIVDIDHVKKANKIINYFMDSAKFVFNDADKTDEIESVSVKLNGKTKAEKIEALHKMKYKQSDIAKKLKVSDAYVSKILKLVKI